MSARARILPLLVAAIVGCGEIADLGAPPALLDDPSDAGDAAPPDAGSDERPLSSCREVLTANAAAPSGIYTITPSSRALQAYCDMDLDGGGWTAFFAGPLGAAHVFAHFEAAVEVCPNPAVQCLRPLPPGDWTTRELAARCGDAAIKFTLGAKAIAYLTSGAQSQWQPLSNVVSLLGDANVGDGRFIYTGEGENEGLIISANDRAPLNTPHTFASSYAFQPVPGSATDWDYCNGAYIGTPRSPPLVRLYYR